MNKKILVSLTVIGVVAAIVIGGTIAYFSDVETSTGNTFTAGKLDLIFQVEGETAVWTDVNGAPLFDGVAFPLDDLKPGDTDEKTVRLWVDNNPACGKVSINVTSDLDNDCTEPELLDDSTCSATGTFNGELNDAVNFLIWLDNGASDETVTGVACDNIMNGIEATLVSGPLTGNVVYSIGELPTVTPVCYGIAYCFGTWGEGMTCDGSAVNNASQSDSFSADLIIDALQKRHQFPNECPGIGVWPKVG